MPFIKLENFSGIVPRLGVSQLPTNAAQIARNVKLQSGELRPWRRKSFEYDLTEPDVQTIYKLYNNASGDFRWLEFTDDVNIVKSPIADDTDFRIYYTGDGTPKKTNWDLATGSGVGAGPYPIASLNLGVPAPTVAPTLSAAGGSGSLETRAYVYTNVSTFGSVTEESAPSPAATVNCFEVGATVTVNGFSAAPTTGYNITHRRIYRTVVGATAVTYQLVVEIPVATTTYDDTKTVAELGSLLATNSWNEPPSDLQGIVTMPNGMLAAFRDNEIWFCEPYYPHAWPDLYTLIVDSTIIGLGVYDTTLVVMTTNQPYLITGSSPLAMSQQKLPMFQPCISKRSITSDQYGVLYASPNGLVSISPQGSDVISQAFYTRDEWQALQPSTMLSMIYNNMYIGFYTVGSTTRSLVLTRNDSPPLVEFDFDATAVFVDRSTADIYAVSKFDNTLYQLDANQVNDTTYEWKSRRFVLPKPMSFAAFKLRADFEVIEDTEAYNALVDQIIASNQAIWATSSGNLGGVLNGATLNTYELNGSILQTIPEIGETRSINVFFYGDNGLYYQTGVTSQEPIRMPGCGKCSIWEILISGNVPVRSLAVATSIEELKAIDE